MSACARRCCWVPMPGVCANSRTCACHWEEKKPRSRTNGTVTYSDPTSNQAIHNVMKERGER